MLVNNGFYIEKIDEPIASQEAISKNPKYINQFDRPFFLIIKAKKNSNDFLNQCKVTSNLYKELDELKNNDNNLDGNFLFSEEGK